jgi:hypothetical protein
MATREEFIAAYLRTRLPQSEADFWAYESMLELHKANPQGAMDMTFWLIEACETDAQLQYVVAGPVEDLLWSGSEERFATFADACNRSPKVLRAMTMLAWEEEDPMFSKWKALLAAHGVTVAVETPNKSLERTHDK